MRLLIPYLVIFTALLFACGTDKEAKVTPLFTSVFHTGNDSLRMLTPGLSVAKVKSNEKRQPKHEDSLGLVWELSLGEGREGSAEYFVSPRREVQAMVLNAFLLNEAEATQLYQEAENHFRTAHGAPSGNYGNFTWGPTPTGLEVNLRMHENSRGLTANFSIPPTP
jgi:hypothetical protein